MKGDETASGQLLQMWPCDKTNTLSTRNERCKATKMKDGWAAPSLKTSLAETWPVPTSTSSYQMSFGSHTALRLLAVFCYGRHGNYDTTSVTLGQVAVSHDNEHCRRVKIADTSLRKRLRPNSMVKSVDKKNQLDVTFCILYFSSNSCSTCFGQPCAHHQQLTTAWCYSLVLLCAVPAGRLSRLLYSLFHF